MRTPDCEACHIPQGITEEPKYSIPCRESHAISPSDRSEDDVFLGHSACSCLHAVRIFAKWRLKFILGTAVKNLTIDLNLRFSPANGDVWFCIFLEGPEGYRAGRLVIWVSGRRLVREIGHPVTLYLEKYVRVAYSLAEIKGAARSPCRLNAIVATPTSVSESHTHIPVEMSDDNSNMSDCSRSPSPLSDVSAQDSVSTANTDFEQAVGLCHFLLLSNKCKSEQELDSALKDLPLRSRPNEYLILALNCARGSGQGVGEAITISQCLEEFGKVVGNEKAFDKWFTGPIGD